MDAIRRDVKDTDTTWDEAEELATDRARWRQSVTQCIHQDASWTKIWGKAWRCCMLVMPVKRRSCVSLCLCVGLFVSRWSSYVQTAQMLLVQRGWTRRLWDGATAISCRLHFTTSTNCNPPRR